MTVKVEDTFEMEGEIGTTKEALTNNIVPSQKFMRKVYGVIINNHDGTGEAGITLTLERDTTVERTLPEVIISAHDTIDVVKSLYTPLFSVKPGQNIKAQVTVGSGPVAVILQAYDL